MAEYVEKGTLHETIAKLEKLARDRYLDTPWDSPVRTRYQAQLNERTNLKHLIFDLPAADVAPVAHGRWEDVRESVVVLRETGFPMETTAETCSVCWFRSCFVGPKVLLHDSTCPNCGARMDGDRQ